MRFFLPAILFLSPAFSQNLTEQYRATADRLIHAALADNDGYAKLAYLCDRIGNRLSGSESLPRAIAWAEETMRRDGLSNVRTIPVKVPHWVRGAESAKLVAPENKPLHMLGLGMSVATPPGGITGEVVVVSDFDELNRVVQRALQGLRPNLDLPDRRAIARGGAGRDRGAGAIGHAARHADPAHRHSDLRRSAAENSRGGRHH
jgi:hypothetical protein